MAFDGFYKGNADDGHYCVLFIDLTLLPYVSSYPVPHTNSHTQKPYRIFQRAWFFCNTPSRCIDMCLVGIGFLTLKLVSFDIAWYKPKVRFFGYDLVLKSVCFFTKA